MMMVLSEVSTGSTHCESSAGVWKRFPQIMQHPKSTLCVFEEFVTTEQKQTEGATWLAVTSGEKKIA